MAPRKKKATAAPTLTFSEPKSGVLMPKNNAPKGEFYRNVEALKVGEMIEVGGASIADARKVVRKVVGDNEGRVFEIRSLNPDDPQAPVGIWRTKGTKPATAPKETPVEPQVGESEI